MTDDDDYERFEDIIDEDFEDAHAMIRWGETTYDKLPITKRDEYFHEKFFKGVHGYEQSASELRTGYDAFKEGNVHKNEEVTHFMRRGKLIHVVRDSETHKIKRWLR